MSEVEKKHGQIKCPKCGSSDIEPTKTAGELRCNFCRNVFKPEKVAGGKISELRERKVSAGAADIAADAKDIITLKCESCGAEVAINTKDSAQARCHWCRNYLSLNHPVPNGAVPDIILPFSVKKEETQEKIEEFVGKRRFFAHPAFRREFTTENIMGVYLPYLLVDVNAHAYFSGVGEHETRKYYVGSGDNREVRYDADAYKVMRDFDIEIEDLAVSSSADKANVTAKDKTTNIIDSVLPFDTENCVKWDANLLRGYSSEKRDLNVEHVAELARVESLDVSRFAANKTLKFYDRGVNWSAQDCAVRGSNWDAAYLPVWLYSYMQTKSNGEKLLHYVAVNGRTKETMGSVPIHKPKLFIVSAIIEIIAIIITAVLYIVTYTPRQYPYYTDHEDDEPGYWFILLAAGFVFYAIIYSRYRNANARHRHETETKNTVKNMQAKDTFFEKRHGLRSSSIDGRNNNYIGASGNAKAPAGLNKVAERIAATMNEAEKKEKK